MFNNLKYFCLFIGHPRNGSSILGGLLDAHKNIIISHEYDVLNHLNKNKIELFDEIVKNSQQVVKKGRKQAGYNNVVEDLWQGRFEKLTVIGDKKADWTALTILNNPNKIKNLEDLVEVPIKFIHTIRNPYDNIATILKRKERNKSYSLLSGKEKYMEKGVVGFYFNYILEGVKIARSSTPDENWFELHHDDLISHPKKTLSKLIQFLDEEVDDEYLNKCAKKVFLSPKITRNRINWNEKSLNIIKNKMKNFDFLKRYTFK